MPRKERDLTGQSAINTTSSYHCPFQKASLPAVHIVYYLLFTDKLQLDHILINDLLWPSYLQIFFLWFQIRYKVIRYKGRALNSQIPKDLSAMYRKKNRCQIRSQSISALRFQTSLFLFTNHLQLNLYVCVHMYTRMCVCICINTHLYTYKIYISHGKNINWFVSLQLILKSTP